MILGDFSFTTLWDIFLKETYLSNDEYVFAVFNHIKNQTKTKDFIQVKSIESQASNMEKQLDTSQLIISNQRSEIARCVIYIVKILR